jgi:hypothetical protein
VILQWGTGGGARRNVPRDARYYGGMREDSASQFVRFKKKGRPEAYATALLLVEHVSEICEHGKARRTRQRCAR